MDDRLLAGGVEGEGGGGNSGNARKKTFFFPGCVPLLGQQLFAADLFLNLLSDVALYHNLLESYTVGV